MDYKETISYLSKTAFKQGIRYDLGPFLKVLERLHHPQKNLPKAILIAGTNGKGSTLTYLAAGFQFLGIRVGTYTSPHFNDYTERISIQNEPISQPDFVTYFEKVQKADPDHTLTEFEILTAMAFLYFNDQKPDILLIETGLGGRLDATNVISPILTIITKIGLDHQAILGKTLPDIAKEKAGIIKPNVPCITLRQSKPVLEVIQKTAKACESPLRVVSPLRSIPKNYVMQGLYQRDNLALARTAIQLVSNTSAEEGFKYAQIWGRYLKLRHKNQTIIIDAAHNQDGARALKKSLKRDFPNQEPLFLIGIYKAKDAKAFLKGLSAFDYCDFEPGFSYSLEDIQRLAPRAKITPYRPDAIPTLPKHPLIVITGSIYFISKFKPFFTI